MNQNMIISHQQLQLYLIYLYYLKMDIFNSKIRTRQDSIKRPIQYPSQQIVQKRLKQQNVKQLEQFSSFLNNLYTKFDVKINKCNVNCISNSNNYKEIRDCQQNCTLGVGKLSKYIDSRVNQMQQLLGQCIANANLLPNTMDQIYYCYEGYNKGFKQLKLFITQENLYYQ